MVILDFSELQLALHQFSCQAHNAYIMSRLKVNHDHIANMGSHGLGTSNVSLAVVLVADFHHVIRRGAIGKRDALQPIKYAHGAASAVPTTTVVFASSWKPVFPYAAR